MKTLIALAIAVSGFSATLAWAAEPVPASTTATAPAAVKAARGGKAATKNARATRTPVVPAFNDRLLQGPAVLCACGRSRTQA